VKVTVTLAGTPDKSEALPTVAVKRGKGHSLDKRAPSYYDAWQKRCYSGGV